MRRNGTASLGLPIDAADGGDACPLFSEDPQPAPDLALLDKEWLTYDRTSRTLAMSYTRFFLGAGGQSGTDQLARPETGSEARIELLPV